MQTEMQANLSAQVPSTKACREVGKDWKHSTSRPFHYAIHSSLTRSLYRSFSLQEHGFTAQPRCPGDRCQATAAGEESRAAGSRQSVSNGMDRACIINTGTDLELHEYSASVAFPQLNLDTHTHKTPKQLSRSTQVLFHKSHRRQRAETKLTGMFTSSQKLQARAQRMVRP